MDAFGIFMLIGSVVIVGVLFLANNKKSYGSRPRKKDPKELPTDYARKKHPPES